MRAGRLVGIDQSFVGTYQSGLPSATEARLLHVWLRGVRLVRLPVFAFAHSVARHISRDCPASTGGSAAEGV